MNVIRQYRSDLLMLLGSLAAWIVIWSLFGGSHAVLPRPGMVFATMFSPAFIQRTLKNPILSTMGWTLAAWGLAMCASFAVAVLGIYIRLVKSFLAFPLIAGRSLPSVLAIPLFAIAAGFGRMGIFLCAFSLTICYSVPSLEESVRLVVQARATLYEALRLGGKSAVLFVLMPGAAKALAGTGAQSFGIAMVVTIAGEMILSITGSIGKNVADFAWLLRMNEVYALLGWLILSSISVNIAMKLLPELLILPAKQVLHQLEFKIKAK